MHVFLFFVELPCTSLHLSCSFRSRIAANNISPYLSDVQEQKKIMRLTLSFDFILNRIALCGISILLGSEGGPKPS